MNNDLPPELLAHIHAVVSLPLVDLHGRVAAWPNQIAETALQMLVQDIRDNPHRLDHEDPDSMHNLVMHAARIERSDIEGQLLRAFADACPGNVDLQADLLQFYYAKRWDPEACERQWEILNSDELVAPADRKTHWRYWMFGALYHARVKHDIATAQELVSRGLEEVPGKYKSDILRNFEDVFIDFATSPLFVQVLEALRKGIAAGWPLGYTLALKLATLLQQQAFASGDAKSDENVGRLREALDWLSVAESLFTNDPNHPVTEIYRARVNVLMGLENYREAIDYIEAFYSHDPKAAQRDPSLRAQFILACRRAGEADLWKKVMGESPAEDGIAKKEQKS
jgi:tetratricopeptide (TPR) repeat protein